MNSNRFRESLRPLRCLLCLPVGVPQGLPIAFEMTGGGGAQLGGTVNSSIFLYISFPAKKHVSPKDL